MRPRLFYGMKIDYVTDNGRIEEVHLSPDFWSWSALPGAPAENGPHAKWMLENGTGIIFHRDDWLYVLSVPSKVIAPVSASSAMRPSR